MLVKNILNNHSAVRVLLLPKSPVLCASQVQQITKRSQKTPKLGSGQYLNNLSQYSYRSSISFPPSPVVQYLMMILNFRQQEKWQSCFM